ncbi:uncharacterized protein ACR2FA_000667 [Aphomia sociella]
MIRFQIYINIGALICLVKSEIICDNKNLTDFNNIAIRKEEYCNRQPCIITFCDENKVTIQTVDKGFLCRNVDHINLPRNLKFELRHLRLVYRYVTKLEKSDFNFDDYRLVKFKDPAMYWSDCGGEWTEVQSTTVPYFLEDGKLMLDTHVGGDPYRIRTLKEYIVIFGVKETTDGYIGPYLYIKNLQLDNWVIQNKKMLFIGVGMAISTFFLIVSLIIYKLLNEELSLDIWQYKAFLASLTVAVLTRASISMGLWAQTIGSTSCLLLSPLHNAALLSCHMWLNTMVFDIFSTYKSLSGRTLVYPNGIMYNIICCILYAWAVPSVIVSIELILDCVNLSNFIRPMFAECSLLRISHIIYVLMPNSFVIAVSLILTLINAYYRKKTEDALPCLYPYEIKIYTKNEKRYVVCNFLMMLLLCNWFCEIIVNGFNVPMWFKFVLETYIAFMGLIVSVTFMITNKTLHNFYKKFLSNKTTSSDIQKKASRDVSPGNTINA